MRKVSLSKLDVAKRELEHAIRLFFLNGDFVVIHLVVSACQKILIGIGGEPISMRAQMIKLIKKEKQKEFSDILNRAYNFFKHSDKDPKGLLEFNPKLNEVPILDAVGMYQYITGELTGLMMAYRGWFYLKYPDYLLQDETREWISNFGKQIDVNNKPQFLDIAELFEQKRTG